MAATEYDAANVTKYNAGGSGDNVISDGYIKSVEKEWIDSCTLTSAQVSASTHNTVDIAMIPSNKKITSIDLTVLGSASLSGGTIAVGHAGDPDAFFSAVVNVTATYATISIPRGMFNYQTLSPCHGSAVMPHTTDGTTGTIQVELTEWAGTTATIKSVVRYT